MMTALDERAARGLGFSLDDLILNRQGLLSERQRVIVQSKYRRYMLRGIAGLALIWLVFMVLIVVMLLTQNPRLADRTVLFAALVSLSLVFVLIGAGTLFHGRNLRTEKVSSIDGEAKTLYRLLNGRFGRSPSWQLWIGRRKFRLTSESEMNAFEQGVDYRLYYVSHAPVHVILSAETLNGSSK